MRAVFEVMVEHGYPPYFAYAKSIRSLRSVIDVMDEMGIELGLDVDRVLDIGRMLQKIVGRPLRSESILNGRVPKAARPQFAW